MARSWKERSENKSTPNSGTRSFSPLTQSGRLGAAVGSSLPGTGSLHFGTLACRRVESSRRAFGVRACGEPRRAVTPLLPARSPRRLGNAGQEGPFAQGVYGQPGEDPQQFLPRAVFGWRLAAGLEGPSSRSQALEVTANPSPVVREQPRPRSGTSQARDAPGREGVQKGPRVAAGAPRPPGPQGRGAGPGPGQEPGPLRRASPRGWDGPGHADRRAASPLIPHSFLSALASATKFRRTPVPAFLHFYIRRLRDDKTLQMF